MFGVFKGLGVTIRQLPKKKVTLMYPEVKPVWPERFRGIHEFIPELCIVCNQCARICPTSCISLSGTRDENKKLRIDTYDINFEICILCDLCTEVCPTESIRMTDQFELASYTRDSLYKDMKWLYQNHIEHGSYKALQDAKAEEEANAAREAQAANAEAASGAGQKASPKEANAAAVPANETVPASQGKGGQPE